MRVLPFDDVEVARECVGEIAKGDAASAAILRHPAYVEWPADPRDRLPLTLWDARSIAERRRNGPRFPGRRCRNGQPRRGQGRPVHRAQGRSDGRPPFLDKAFANGAAGAIVDRPRTSSRSWSTTPPAPKRWRVLRAAVSKPIIGVTGSAGKTGVKEAIFASLERASRGAAHRSTRCQQPRRRPAQPCPDACAQPFRYLRDGHEPRGRDRGPTTQVRPHVAVITTIAPAHIENLGSMEAIADAKAEIFAGLEPGGTAVIPDSEHYDRLRACRGARRRQGGQLVAHASPTFACSMPFPAPTAAASTYTPKGGCATPSPNPAITDQPPVMASARLAATWRPPGWRWPKWAGSVAARGTGSMPGRQGAAHRRKLQRQSRQYARHAGAARADPRGAG